MRWERSAISAIERPTTAGSRHLEAPVSRPEAAWPGRDVPASYHWRHGDILCVGGTSGYTDRRLAESGSSIWWLAKEARNLVAPRKRVHVRRFTRRFVARNVGGCGRACWPAARSSSSMNPVTGGTGRRAARSPSSVQPPPGADQPLPEPVHRAGQAGAAGYDGAEEADRLAGRGPHQRPACGAGGAAGGSVLAKCIAVPVRCRHCAAATAAAAPAPAAGGSARASTGQRPGTARASMPAVAAPPPAPAPRKPVQSAPLAAPHRPPTARPSPSAPPAVAPARRRRLRRRPSPAVASAAPATPAAAAQPALPAAPPPRPAAAGPAPAAARNRRRCPSRLRRDRRLDRVRRGLDHAVAPAADEVKAFAGKRGNGVIVVTGFGDAASSDPAAQSAALTVGLARAAAIAEALKADGVPANAVRVNAEASGRGGVAPLATLICFSIPERPVMSSDSSGEFHRIRRLPPYVFAEVNTAKAKARGAGGGHHRPGHGQPRQPDPAAYRRQAGRDGAGPAHRTAIPSARASPGLRRALAGYYQRRFDVKLDPETEVVATLGSKEGLANLASAITSPGDTILVPNPSYPIHQFGFIIAGAAVRSMPGHAGRGHAAGAGPRGAAFGAEADRADRQLPFQPDGLSRGPRLLPRDRRVRPPARDLDHVRPCLCRDLFRRQGRRRRSCRCRGRRTSRWSSPACRRPTPCRAGAWASPPATRG